MSEPKEFNNNLISIKKEIDISFLSIAKDLFCYIPSKIIPALGGFIGIVIYTRLLNPKGYGLYILAFTTIGLIESIAFRWLDRSSLRYFEEYNKRDETILFISNSVISLILTYAIILIIYYATIILLKEKLNNDLIYLLKIGGLLLITISGYNFIMAILQAQRKSGEFSIICSIESIGVLLLAVFFLSFFSMGPEGILWAIFIVTGIIFCFKLICFYRKWDIKISIFSRNLLKKFITYGFPLIGASIGMIILNVSDRYMIEYFLGTQAVGIYSAGYKLVDSCMTMIIQILLLTMTPVIFQAFEHKKMNSAKSLIQNLLSIYLIIALPMVFGIIVLSKQIIGIILGRLYQNAYIILPWVALGMFFWGLTSCMHKPFEMKHKTILITYVVLLVSILNIILNIFLIPILGIVGAAIATFISYFFSFGLTLFIVKRIFPIKFPWKNLTKSFLSACCMIIFILFGMSKYPETVCFFAIKVILGAIIYFIVLGVLKEETFFKILLYFKNSFRVKYNLYQ